MSIPLLQVPRELETGSETGEDHVVPAHASVRTLCQLLFLHHTFRHRRVTLRGKARKNRGEARCGGTSCLSRCNVLSSLRRHRATNANVLKLVGPKLSNKNARSAIAWQMYIPIRGGLRDDEKDWARQRQVEAKWARATRVARRQSQRTHPPNKNQTSRWMEHAAQPS